MGTTINIMDEDENIGKLYKTLNIFIYYTETIKLNNFKILLNLMLLAAIKRLTDLY